MAGWNGSGVFSKTHSWVQDKLNGIKVRADRHDANDVDFVNGINNCITKDGQNSATADLPMDGNKHTGVGNAAAADEYATLGQVVNNASKYYTTGGAADAYTLTPSPAITAYTAGQQFYVKISATNTTASTINVNALGVKSIVKDVSTALVAGDLEQDRVYSVIYDGTNFQVQPTGSLAWQDANAVAITGGTINGVAIGTTTPATQAVVDNIDINGNTISTTDTDGDLVLSPNGAGRIDVDTSIIENVTDPTAAQHAATKNYVDTSRPEILAKVIWTAGTPALQSGSRGVSSITDNGAGDVSINFSSNFANTNYIVVVLPEESVGGIRTPFIIAGGHVVGGVRIGIDNGSGSLADPDAITVACWRSA